MAPSRPQLSELDHDESPERAAAELSMAELSMAASDHSAIDCPKEASASLSEYPSTRGHTLDGYSSSAGESDEADFNAESTDENEFDGLLVDGDVSGYTAGAVSFDSASLGSGYVAANAAAGLAGQVFHRPASPTPESGSAACDLALPGRSSAFTRVPPTDTAASVPRLASPVAMVAPLAEDDEEMDSCKTSQEQSVNVSVNTSTMSADLEGEMANSLFNAMRREEEKRMEMQQYHDDETSQVRRSPGVANLPSIAVPLVVSAR